MTRELDIAMNGAQDAAPQASLRDLVPQAEELGKLLAGLRKLHNKPDAKPAQLLELAQQIAADTEALAEAEFGSDETEDGRRDRNWLNI